MNVIRKDGTCSATVFGPRVHSWGCTRKAVVERNGKGYCKQHDPDAVEERKRVANRAYRAERDADNAKMESAEALCRIIGMGAPHYAPSFTGRMGGYDGGIILNATEAQALADTLTAIRRKP